MSLARTVKGKITISACRSRSKMSSTQRRCVSRRQPKGSHALRSSFGRRMTKFFTTALNTVSPSSSNKDRDVAFWQILLQKSKVASAEIFSETLKREPVDDSDNLSRASEVAYEFCMRR